MAGHGEIARVLAGARRRQARILALAAASQGLAGALACLLAGAAALALGARLPVARPVAWGGAIAALALAVGRAMLVAARTAWTPEAAARSLGAGTPGLGSDLVSAVELGRDREDIVRTGRFSLALVDGHIERAAERIRGVDLARALPDRGARRGGLALLGVALAHLLALAAGGGALVHAYRQVLAAEPSRIAPRAADPITGDVEITYRYPAYMRRDPATVSGTGGEVRAPRGTEVRLRTRADRDVAAAEIVLEISPPLPPAEPGGEGGAGGGRPEQGAGTAAPRRLALQVQGTRDLSGAFLLDGPGAYRFRFLDRRGRIAAEGPPIPVAVEPDAFPEVRITSPGQEVEVDAGARVSVEWYAADDVGLGELFLVTKPPSSGESRRSLRTFEGARRDSGAFDLDSAALGLAEGDRLLYWLEVADGDVVSGPKRSASATQVVRIYSEAEHRRELLERARAAWEEMVGVLADRLELSAGGPAEAGEGLARADALDQRVRALHERMRKVANDIRQERAAPRDLSAGLANVAATVRVAEQRATAARQGLQRAARLRARPDPQILRQSRAFDAQLEEALEKGVLYLEQLLDKRRAEDLVLMAKDLAARRRDLAGLLEKYRKAPTEEARKEVLARIAHMKERMRELASRMAELARGFQDEHMNAEALAEMSRTDDVLSGLDEVESLLARGDVEGALRELDALGGSMERMLAGLQRTAGIPDENSAELMRQMLAFKRDLEEVEADQEKVASETEAVREEYRRQVRERMQRAEAALERLERLAAEARGDVAAARPGVAARAEGDFEAAQRGLEDAERALAARDLDAALESASRALSPLQRLALSLEEDASMAERYGEMVKRDRTVLREAQRRAFQAVPKATEVRDELARLFPDPRTALGEPARRRLEALRRRQEGLERRAGELQQGLSRLMREAPVFPPSAAGTLSESRGHMGQAAEALGRGNPQRGAGEQALALDALSRFRKGLEEAARRSGGAGGSGFPFPFAEQGGSSEGEGFEPSRERVEIPGAEAYKVPEEFRKDLLEAMRQGTPERYRGEVQRYYEELVK
ncbi:MAG TPA: DUF4175 family protein [Anaeromyxobacteraceae bacterium]|nr:DUF4175 family protein [Anaeromyxobacteraceae bacterium]